MARRKRLTPPTPLPDAPDGPLETKAMPFRPTGAPLPGGYTIAPQSTSSAPVARVAGDQAQAAALHELADEITRAREGGPGVGVVV